MHRYILSEVAMVHGTATLGSTPGAVGRSSTDYSLVRGIGSTAARYAPLPLRIILGIGFLLHGWPKLFGGHAGFSSMLSGINIPASDVIAWAIGMLEVFGGLALVAGAFVGLFSVLFIIEMIVAAVKVHLPSGFMAVNVTGMGPQGPVFGMPGFEVNLLYIAGLLALFLLGAGAWSVDESLRRKRIVAMPATDLR
jgi:putative oxidoreductase